MREETEINMHRHREYECDAVGFGLAWAMTLGFLSRIQRVSMIIKLEAEMPANHVLDEYMKMLS